MYTWEPIGHLFSKIKRESHWDMDISILICILEEESKEK